jgi:hypothetical protein
MWITLFSRNERKTCASVGRSTYAKVKNVGEMALVLALSTFLTLALC